MRAGYNVYFTTVDVYVAGTPKYDRRLSWVLVMYRYVPAACGTAGNVYCGPYRRCYRGGGRGGGGPRGGNYNRSGCDPPPSYLSKLAGGGGGRGGVAYKDRARPPPVATAMVARRWRHKARRRIGCGAVLQMDCTPSRPLLSDTGGGGGASNWPPGILADPPTHPPTSENFSSGKK